MSFQLRYYQQEAHDAIFNYFMAGNTGNPLVSMDTGLGKSLTMAEFIKTVITTWPTQRILCLVHNKQLVKQNSATMVRHCVEADVGVYCAGLRRKDTYNQVIYASIQSVHKKHMQLGVFDLVIVDEAHLIDNKENGIYRKFLNNLKALNPYLKVIGFTATPYRLGGGCLTHGKQALFTDIIYETDMLRMIDEGYLAPLTTRDPETHLDLSGIGKSKGEYVTSQLEAAVDDNSFIDGVMRDIRKYAWSRRSWIVFCPTIANCEHFTEVLKNEGITAAIVHGGTKERERDHLFAAHKGGSLKALVSVGVLTTGFDSPPSDLLICLRSTLSPGLWKQMAGRVARISPETEKKDGLILDFSGNVEEHGPIDQIKAPRPKGEGGGVAPVKTCPQCRLIIHASKMQCPECGFIFESIKEEQKAEASKAAILSNQFMPPFDVDVINVFYVKHQPKDKTKPPSLKVTYMSDFTDVYNEFICLEHDGYARKKAEQWWKERMLKAGIASDESQCVVPVTVDTALPLTKSFPEPVGITVRKEGKYDRVLGYQWG